MRKKLTGAMKQRRAAMKQRHKVIAYNTSTGEEYVYVRRANIRRDIRWSVIDRYGKHSFLLDKNLTLVKFHDEANVKASGSI